MQISFEIKDKSTIAITVRDGAKLKTYTQNGSPELGIAWTRAEAVEWAEKTVAEIEEAASDNRDWVRPIYPNEIVTLNLRNFIGEQSAQDFFAARKILIESESD